MLLLSDFNLVISLHFFLLFAETEAGCLLPSLPSDATLDPTSGISFLCDLNDNIAAPWPTTSQVQASSCNKSMSWLLYFIHLYGVPSLVNLLLVPSEN